MWRCCYLVNLLSSQQPDTITARGRGRGRAGRRADIEILEPTHSSRHEAGCSAAARRYWRYAAHGAEFCEALHRDTGTRATDTAEPARSFGKTSKRKVDICHDCVCPDCCRAVIVDTAEGGNWNYVNSLWTCYGFTEEIFSATSRKENKCIKCKTSSRCRGILEN